MGTLGGPNEANPCKDVACATFREALRGHAGSEVVPPRTGSRAWRDTLTRYAHQVQIPIRLVPSSPRAITFVGTTAVSDVEAMSTAEDIPSRRSAAPSRT